MLCLAPRWNSKEQQKAPGLEQGVTWHKGFAFAFQVLGYFAWQHGAFGQGVIDDYRQCLDGCAYEKTWSKLSAGDRRVALAIAQPENGKASDVRRILGMETNQLNPYRSRLIKKGIVDGGARAHICHLA